MKIKRLKQIRVNSFLFKVTWDKTIPSGGGSFSYQPSAEIRIGVKDNNEEAIYGTVCHELLELCAVEMHVRFDRRDVQDDYLFSFDHRQFETMANMFAGLLAQFVGDK
jgi:hypothetical protein